MSNLQVVANHILTQTSQNLVVLYAIYCYPTTKFSETPADCLIPWLDNTQIPHQPWMLLVPAESMLKFDPERSSGFINLPSNSAPHANATYIFPGLIKWYNTPWCGMCQVLPKDDVSVWYIGISFDNKVIHKIFVIRAEPFIFPESSFKTFHPS